MSYPVDEALFEQLSEYVPGEVCSRTGASWDQAKKHYRLRFWGDDFIVDPYGKLLNRVDGADSAGHGYLSIFLINYLMQAGGQKRGGELVSEKDLAGGATFFRGPHEIPTSLITSRFENDLQGFCSRCKSLGGTPLEMADRAYEFTPAPHFSLAVLYWQGDDEFPAEARLLFDRASVSGLALDTVYALAVEACRRIAKK